MFIPSRCLLRALRHACRQSVATRHSTLKCHRSSAFYSTVSEPPVKTKRVRKSKAKTETIRFDTSLPQGLLDDGPIPLDPIDSTTSSNHGYPTVIQQARNNMQRFEHCVLLTRVGSFYELYFEHAEQYGPLLGLKVGSKKTSAGPVAMAGFPFFQLERFLKMLVQEHGKHVAISEETANDPSQKIKSGGLLFSREVKRIVTPGTLIDEDFLSPYEHNYLLAIAPDLPSSSRESSVEGDSVLQTPIGLSWIDLSSGDFFTQSTTLDNLPSALARVAPKEIILGEQKHENIVFKTLLTILREQGHLLSFSKGTTELLTSQDWVQLLEETAAVDAVSRFSSEEASSSNLLLQYVKEQLPGLKLKLQAPVRQSSEEYMIIDKNSLRGLEITQTLRDGLFKGSLLQAVRRTSTESGARLLSQRLTSPSTSLVVINERLDLVGALMDNEVLLSELGELLRRTYDTLRLIQKFSFGRGNADDLQGLARTINLTRSIGDLLLDTQKDAESPLAKIHARFQWDTPSRVADSILAAIDEEGLTLQQQSQELNQVEAAGLARNVLEQEALGSEMSDLRKSLSTKRFNKVIEAEEDKPSTDDIWIMRRDASLVLRSLHEKLEELCRNKHELGTALKEQLGATTLTLKFTPGLGHICHVKGKDTKLDVSILEDARTVGSSKSTRSFYLPAWTRLGSQIEDIKLRIRAEEQRVFQSLRDLVIQSLVPLRRNAALLDELDVASSSARLAQEFNLQRPSLNNSTNHLIYGGRHMVVEAGLLSNGRQFIPNDCILDSPARIWLLTGPNMAGKSTFLRQTALISILAQTGMYVPAAYADIGLVDQIFSRIGSADNLSQDQSTFMVEMLETAHILRHATNRSFVIMDEVGRGTTPEDGVAVGYAVLHHLQHVNKCRTLFATHFHALTDMTRGFEGLACYCTNVVEEGEGRFRYDHKVRRGVNRQSHALKVARLAGMPEGAIEVAKGVLKELGDESVFVDG